MQSLNESPADCVNSKFPFKESCIKRQFYDTMNQQAGPYISISRFSPCQLITSSQLKAPMENHWPLPFHLSHSGLKDRAFCTDKPESGDSL